MSLLFKVGLENSFESELFFEGSLSAEIFRFEFVIEVNEVGNIFGTAALETV